MFKLKIDDELHLELIHFSHAKEMFSVIDSNREVFKKWLIWLDSVQRVEDEEEAIKGFLSKYAQRRVVNCVIFYKGVLVGDVELGIHKGYGIKKGELGYWLDSKFHGKGIMQRAAKTMLAMGFNEYALDKIILKCALSNERSCNVAQKLGMRHEGRLIGETKLNGVLMDVDIYGILKSEFARVFSYENTIQIK